MKHFAAAALLLLAASGAGAQVCSETITLRSDKGAALTHEELDDNFRAVEDMCSVTVEDWPTDCSDGQILIADSGAMVCSAAPSGGTIEVAEADGSPDVSGVTRIEFDGATVTDDTGGQVTVTITGGGGSPLTVREQDSSPSVANVTEIRVSNSTLTDEGGGAVSITTGGGGGGGAPTDAEYVVAAAHGDLSAERVLSSGTNTSVSTGSGTIAVNVASASTSAAGVVELATDGESAAGVAVQSNDGRLSDARAPTGAAGGHLTGTYPDPSVRDATTGQTGIVQLAGDLGGTASSPAVTGLQGEPLDAGTPDEGDVLRYLDDEWIAASLPPGLSLTVRDETGVVVETDVDTIRFPDGSVSVNSTGDVSVAAGGGGGSDPLSAVYNPDRPPSSCAFCEEFYGNTESLTWRWANQDDAIVTYTGDTMLLDSVDNSGSGTTNELNVRWFTGSSPGDSFTLTAKLKHATQGVSNTGAGILILASGSEGSPSLMYGIRIIASNAAVSMFSIDGYGGSESNVANLGSILRSNSTASGYIFGDDDGAFPVWMQLRYDDATMELSAWVSTSGGLDVQPTGWVFVGSATLAGHPTASHGVFYNARNTTVPSGNNIQAARFFYIRERTDPAGLAGEVGE